jgi:hypothetical protein
MDLEDLRYFVTRPILPPSLSKCYAREVKWCLGRAEL